MGSPSWHFPASVCPPPRRESALSPPRRPFEPRINSKGESTPGQADGTEDLHVLLPQLSSQVLILKTSTLELPRGSPMGSGDTRGLISPLLPLPALPAVPHALQSHC